MQEKLTDALEEIKRVDHLIYVSLKYTRTVDVIVNILNRMVDAYALVVDALLAYAKAQEKVSVEPESAIERAQAVQAVFGADDMVVDSMSLYLLLRKLLRARNVERENEYRRHVTMKTVIEGREEIVNIDIITNYYLFLREFVAHARAIIEGTVAIELRQQALSMPEAPMWMTPEVQQRDDPEPARVARTPPVKIAVKIRPVTAPPRKRVPRPKKYKIQIPKGLNPIMRPPFQHDPKYNSELRKPVVKAVVKAVKKVVKKIVKKAPKAKKKR